MLSNKFSHVIRSVTFNKLVFSMACPGRYNPWNVLAVTNECHYGDWVFLYYIAKNLDNYVFKELLQKLAEDLQERRQIQPHLFSEEKPLTSWVSVLSYWYHLMSNMIIPNNLQENWLRQAGGKLKKSNYQKKLLLYQCNRTPILLMEWFDYVEA